jgi:hypothetical protein
MQNREKILLVVTIILALVLIFKSIVLDTYRPENEAESQFYEKISTIIEERYSGWVFDYKIVTTKIIDISEMTEKEKTVKKGDETITVNGVYKAKVRKYVFYIIPFADDKILDINLEK